MKRFFGFLLAVMYSLGSIGATMQVHYCMGEKVSTHLTQHNHDKCPKCGMRNGNSKGCCKDVKTVIKTSDHAQVKYLSVSPAVAFALLPQKAAYEAITITTPLIAAAAKQRVKAPPLLFTHCAVFLFVRNIRI